VNEPRRRDLQAIEREWGEYFPVMLEALLRRAPDAFPLDTDEMRYVDIAHASISLEAAEKLWYELVVLTAERDEARRKLRNARWIMSACWCITVVTIAWRWL
jgi:hypothetical protein